MYWYMYLQFAIVNFSERLEKININRITQKNSDTTEITFGKKKILQNKMLLFTCQTGYITRYPSNIHKVNNVIVCHLALLGGKGLRHLKSHMVILKMLCLTTK